MTGTGAAPKPPTRQAPARALPLPPPAVQRRAPAPDAPPRAASALRYIGRRREAPLDAPLDQRQLLLPQGGLSVGEAGLLGRRVAVDIACLHAAARLPRRCREVEKGALRQCRARAICASRLPPVDDREIEDQAHRPRRFSRRPGITVVLSTELDRGIGSLGRGDLAGTRDRQLRAGDVELAANGKARPRSARRESSRRAAMVDRNATALQVVPKRRGVQRARGSSAADSGGSSGFGSYGAKAAPGYGE